MGKHTAGSGLEWRRKGEAIPTGQSKLAEVSCSVVERPLEPADHGSDQWTAAIQVAFRGSKLHDPTRGLAISNVGVRMAFNSILFIATGTSNVTSVTDATFASMDVRRDRVHAQQERAGSNK